MDKERIMQLGALCAEDTMKRDIGGPFGAVIAKDDKVVVVESNSVLQDHDPTAHAEMNAIRKACKKLGTHDLSGYELYATGYPCPMCMSAIIWANIKKVYVSGTVEDAEEIGFRDKFIYDFIKDDCKDTSIVSFELGDRKPAQELYRKYAEMNKEMY